jgi:hypothetical protein
MVDHFSTCKTFVSYNKRIKKLTGECINFKELGKSVTTISRALTKSHKQVCVNIKIALKNERKSTKVLKLKAEALSTR